LCLGRREGHGCRSIISKREREKRNKENNSVKPDYFGKGNGRKERKKNTGFPRPGGNFVAPGKNTRAFLDQGHGCRSRINYFEKGTGGKKEKYDSFPRPGGDLVAPSNKAQVHYTK
jgi:hypothetical protein